jgi:hypothetical protein
VNDENISDAKLAVEHEEDVPTSLGARLTGSSTGLKGRKEGLLRGGDPPLAHRAAHNFYKVVIAHHAKCFGGRTCMVVL